MSAGPLPGVVISKLGSLSVPLKFSDGEPSVALLPQDDETGQWGTQKEMVKRHRHSPGDPHGPSHLHGTLTACKDFTIVRCYVISVSLKRLNFLTSHGRWKAGAQVTGAKK